MRITVKVNTVRQGVEMFMSFDSSELTYINWEKSKEDHCVNSVSFELKSSRAEAGESSIFVVKNEEDMAMLLELNKTMQNVPPYFEDNTGNIIPFCEIRLLNKSSMMINLKDDTKVRLSQDEWVRCNADYRNWLDLQ